MQENERGESNETELNSILFQKQLAHCRENVGTLLALPPIPPIPPIPPLNRLGSAATRSPPPPVPLLLLRQTTQGITRDAEVEADDVVDDDDG